MAVVQADAEHVRRTRQGGADLGWLRDRNAQPVPAQRGRNLVPGTARLHMRRIDPGERTLQPKLGGVRIKPHPESL